MALSAHNIAYGGINGESAMKKRKAWHGENKRISASGSSKHDNMRVAAKIYGMAAMAKTWQA